MKCPGGWIPVRYPPITTKNGRRLPGDILAAFDPQISVRMGPTAFQALLNHLREPCVLPGIYTGQDRPITI